MDILITESHEIITDCLQIFSKKKITKDCRLFYELGTYTVKDINGWIKESWKRSGYYKEIKDPLLFKKHDKDLNRLEYIEHHNFVVSPLTTT